MSSRKAIPKKPLLQSNVLLRILVKDFYLKILFGDKLRIHNISCEATSQQRFPPRFLALAQPKKHPFNIRG